MNWIKITSVEDIANIKIESEQKPVLIFKHSTRCSISSMALSRLERSWKNEQIAVYFLDLISFRELSQSISTEFNIMHESPQVLLIKSGKCIYHNSHMGINSDDIIAHA